MAYAAAVASGVPVFLPQRRLCVHVPRVAFRMKAALVVALLLACDRAAGIRMWIGADVESSASFRTPSLLRRSKGLGPHTAVTGSYGPLVHFLPYAHLRSHGRGAVGTLTVVDADGCNSGDYPAHADIALVNSGGCTLVRKGNACAAAGCSAVLARSQSDVAGLGWCASLAQAPHPCRIA